MVKYLQLYSLHPKVFEKMNFYTGQENEFSSLRHVDDDAGRTFELEQSAVKCMRGLLFFYMQQADKVK